MPDSLAARYDAIPYRHGAIAESHPARIGAIARILGISARPPDRCRVLEVGCAEGMNLLPLAERFPSSEFTGLDISPAQIAVGEAARIACGIENARLVCGDLRSFDMRSFDYIIAHGVYSWVPDDAKDALLSMIARALAPGGVAYVSYNVHPAAGPIASLRAIVRTELDRLTPVEEPEAATRLLTTLSKCFASMPTPHAAATRALLGEMLAKPIALCLNDELATVNDPVTFLAFSAHAAQHGLRFLAEAHFASMPIEHLPAATHASLIELGLDAMRTQQFLDLIGNRALRNSLLIHSNEITRELDASIVGDCAIGFHMFPADGRLDLAAGVPVKFEGRHGFAISVDNSAQKAFFAALCEAAPARLHFVDACKRATELLRLGNIAIEIDEALLRAGLLKLFTVDQLDLLLSGNGDWLQSASSPSRLMRWQAANHFSVTSRWHENVAVSDEDRRWIAGIGNKANRDALLRTGLCG